MKIYVLGISKLTIEKYTPESAEVTRVMAQRLKVFMKAEMVVAVTGLTTSGGSETPEKPVGTMFYCVAFKDQIFEVREVFKGSPTEIVDLTIDHIAGSIINILKADYDK